MTAGIERIIETMKADARLPDRVRESDEDSYEWAVAQRVLAVIIRLDALRDTQRLLRGVPALGALRRLQMSPETWLQYHYAVYVVTLSSIGDVALLLVNAVLALGHAPRYCTSDVIRSNRWVRKAKIPAALDGFETLIKQHRERRNLHLHRGTEPDLSEATGTDTFDLLKFASIMSRIRNDDVTARRLVDAFREEGEAVAAVIDQELDALVEAIKVFFDVLHPEFSRRARPNPIAELSNER